MFNKRLGSPLILLFSLLSSACGLNAESAIATSVALTVQAQSAFTPTLAAVTATPLPGATLLPTLTSIAQPTSTSAPSGNSFAECAQASLVSEDPGDGIIFQPSTTFTKKWYVRNESNCVWNTSYKIIFWDGDVMGGGYVYNFPQSALPGDTIEIPLVLIAPDTVGTHTGYWKFQTPDGTNFGVGQFSEAVYVEIEVSTDISPEYGITSVTYVLERSPSSGCATNVRYTVYATVSVNGPVTVKVRWEHSDGFSGNPVSLTFSGAGSQQISDTWAIHLGSSTGDKWIELVSTTPARYGWGKQQFSYLCQ